MAERKYNNVAYLMQRESGKYDLFINGRKNLEAKDVGYETGTAKAEKVLKNLGGGYIIVEHPDSPSKLIDCYE